MWRHEQARCACCWRPADYQGHLQVHHIIKSGRSDERCNFLALCFTFDQWSPRCHDLAEGLKIRRRDGSVWETLSLANCLWLKWESNPDEFDLKRLTELAHKNLPEPERPHQDYFESRFRIRRFS